MEKIDVSNVKIGETIEVDGKQYVCKAENKYEGCKGCALAGNCGFVLGCGRLNRPDGQGIIFVEADKAQSGTESIHTLDVSNVNIGETIEIEGKKYVCTSECKQDVCEGCAFKDVECPIVGCSYLHDHGCGKGVIFVEADKAEADKAQPDPSLEKVKEYDPAKTTEYKIDEVFEYKGKKYRCEYGEMRRCKDCAFRHDVDACISAVCSRLQRKDAKSVIFIEIPSFDPATIPDGMKLIPAELYDRLNYLGLIPNGIRSHNVGTSDYAKHVIQPWSVWLDYPGLTSWDHDIIKRVLRTKSDNPRQMDYEKIIHDCQERLRQLEFRDEQTCADTTNTNA